MNITVHFYEDVNQFSSAAEAFLVARPTLHNLILTIVEARQTRPEPGRYWVARRDEQVVGLPCSRR